MGTLLALVPRVESLKSRDNNRGGGFLPNSRVCHHESGGGHLAVVVTCRSVLKDRCIIRWKILEGSSQSSYRLPTTKSLLNTSLRELKVYRMSEAPNVGWNVSLKLQIYWIKVKLNFQCSFQIGTLELSLQISNVLCWIIHQLSSVKQPRSHTRGWLSFQTHQLASFSLCSFSRGRK